MTNDITDPEPTNPTLALLRERFGRDGFQKQVRHV